MVYRLSPLRRTALVSAAALVTVLLCLPLRALADSYDVQAQVYSSTLTQPAMFTSGLDGTTTANGSATVDGSCQMLNQATVISIWRDGASLGSTICNSGTFRLAIILKQGANTLIARSSDASGNYGPDSQPISISLNLPPSNPVPASVASGSEPATPADEQAAVNAGVADKLIVATAAPFSVISNQKTVSVDVNVSGGNQPYVIMLNWGDGTTESHSVAQTGTYSYTHTYQKASNYQIKGAVRDVLGAYTEFSYAVVSYTKKTPATASAAPSTRPAGPPDRTALYTAVTGGVIVLGLLTVYGGYRLGLHQASKAAVQAMRRQRSKRAVRPKQGGNRARR